MKQLPVLQILNEGVDTVWAKRGALFVGLVPVSLIWMLYDFVAGHLVITGEDGFGMMGEVLLSYSLLLLYIPIYTAFAVTVHRLVLVGNRAVPWYGQLFFTYRELKFCAYIALAWLSYYFIVTILGALLINAIEIPSVSTPLFVYWVIFMANLLTAYPLARISLSFPAIAVDYFFGLRKTWRLSKGNSLRLYLCVSLLPTLFWFLMRYLPDTSSVLLNAFYSFASYVMLAVEIAILSVCYRWLVHSDQSRLEETGQGDIGTDQD